MIRAKFILLFLVIANSIFAQITVSGFVLDKDTRAPLPYAFIVKKGLGTGAITNEDGAFKLICNATDTLIISYVSYYKSEVPCTYFLDNNALYLKEKTNMLIQVTVHGNLDLDPYLDIISEGKEKIQARKDYDTKAYFTLESQYHNQPAELLECYYNANIGTEGIQGLSLKNGRIGLAEIDSNFYVSLHTTTILSEYKLFTKKGNDFPSNPLHYSKKKQKKYYNIKLAGVREEIYKLKFTPKKKYKGLFHAYIWIDKQKRNIIKTELFNQALERHPLLGIDPNHHINDIDYNVVYTFGNNRKQDLKKIEFKYNLDYDNSKDIRKVITAGAFLFYERNQLFDLPYFPDGADMMSDYDKIVSQPYNKLFWQYNEILSPSRKVLENRQFFKENGVLLNFSELSKRNKIFRNRFMPWDTTRLTLTDINGEYSFNVDPTFEKKHYNSHSTSRFYSFDGGLYLDRNAILDTTFYLSSTQVNLDETYYYLKPNRFTIAMINMIYDLMEIERRELMNILESREWSKAQVDSIYEKSSQQLDARIYHFLRAVDLGNEEKELRDYVKKINYELSIDNSSLISDLSPKIETTIFEGEDDEMAQLYNYGSALANLGNYEEALSVLLKGEESGLEHPWLFHNIGFCYYMLKNNDKACHYFSKVIAAGEEVDSELVKNCQFTDTK